MDVNQNLLSSELQIDAAGYAHLKETAMWAKFLAITGFVLSILFVFIGIFAGSFMATLTKGYSQPGMEATAAGASVLTFFYVIFAVVYFFLSLFLYRFAIKMRTALSSHDQESLNGSLFNLKLVYRMLGIIMIVYIGLMALGLIAVIGMASLR